MIITTNPRRIGAESVAERVASLRKTEVGEEVGYKVRFDKKISSKTKLFFMTDGMVLSEILIDPLLSSYNVLIIDEAHERSINTDFLLSYSISLVKQRSDIKIIISSATINSYHLEQFYQKYGITFGKISIIGRSFTVTMRYGIGKYNGNEMTQKEVADFLGISQSYISRLEKKIIRRLKKEIVRYN